MSPRDEIIIIAMSYAVVALFLMLLLTAGAKFCMDFLR